MALLTPAYVSGVICLDFSNLNNMGIEKKKKKSTKGRRKESREQSFNILLPCYNYFTNERHGRQEGLQPLQARPQDLRRRTSVLSLRPKTMGVPQCHEKGTAKKRWWHPPLYLSDGAPKPKRWRMHMVEPPAALPIISPISASSSCVMSQVAFSSSLVPIAPMPQPSVKGDAIQSQQQQQQQQRNNNNNSQQLLLSELIQEVQRLRQNTTQLKETHKVLTKQFESIDTTANNTSQSIRLPMGARLSYAPFVMRYPLRPHALVKAEVVPGQFQPGVLLERAIDLNGKYGKLLGYHYVSVLFGIRS